MIAETQIRFGSTLMQSGPRARRVYPPRASYHKPAIAVGLTRRLMECAALVSLGLSNTEIAERLHISDGTVKIYISEAFGRLRLRGRLALALWYRDNFGKPGETHDALMGVYE